MTRSFVAGSRKISPPLGVSVNTKMASNKIIVNPDLKSVVYDLLVAGFAEFEEKDVTVGINSPDNPGLLPFIAINLLSDAETMANIGDCIADELVDNQVYAGIGNEWTQQVEVKLWSLNAAERDRLGLLMKAILKSGAGTSANPGLYLTTPGLQLPKIGGGYDEGVVVTSEQYPSQTIYMRTYVLTANTTLTIQEPTGSPVGMIRVIGESVVVGSNVVTDVLTAKNPGGF